MEAGWSTMTRTVPNFAASWSNTARSLGSLVGQLLVENLLGGRGEPVPVMGALTDVQAEEDAHVVDVVQPVLSNEVRAAKT
jgi:hypothetical protein